MCGKKSNLPQRNARTSKAINRHVLKALFTLSKQKGVKVLKTDLLRRVRQQVRRLRPIANMPYVITQAVNSLKQVGMIRSRGNVITIERGWVLELAKAATSKPWAKKFGLAAKLNRRINCAPKVKFRQRCKRPQANSCENRRLMCNLCPKCKKNLPQAKKLKNSCGKTGAPSTRSRIKYAKPIIRKRKPKIAPLAKREHNVDYVMPVKRHKAGCPFANGNQTIINDSTTTYESNWEMGEQESITSLQNFEPIFEDSRESVQTNDSQTEIYGNDITEPPTVLEAVPSTQSMDITPDYEFTQDCANDHNYATNDANTNVAENDENDANEKTQPRPKFSLSSLFSWIKIPFFS